MELGFSKERAASAPEALEVVARVLEVEVLVVVAVVEVAPELI